LHLKPHARFGYARGMKAHRIVIMAMTLGACTRTHGEEAKTIERSATKSPPTFVLQERLCVPEASTIDLPADRQAPVRERIGACGSFVDDATIDANPISCGPCGFTFDPAVTRNAREQVADACCYAVSSPPPPPPPPQPTMPDPDARFACTKNGDCLASWLHVQGHRASDVRERGLRRPSSRAGRPDLHAARRAAARIARALAGPRYDDRDARA
jgi:hypothetical protein